MLPALPLRAELGGCKKSKSGACLVWLKSKWPVPERLELGVGLHAQRVPLSTHGRHPAGTATTSPRCPAGAGRQGAEGPTNHTYLEACRTTRPRPADLGVAPRMLAPRMDCDMALFGGCGLRGDDRPEMDARRADLAEGARDGVLALPGAAGWVTRSNADG